MSSSSVTVPSGSKTTPLNFIYACSICCCSFADVYGGHYGTVQGFSDGINPKDRLVTQLYLASCCHVFCGKHLRDAAPPFHPEGERPKESCPVCMQEAGDETPRDLYSIRGFEKDEHDPMIPAIWFDVPPAKLNEKGEEMEALRFQYLALVRYCQHTYATRKPLQDALLKYEKKIAKTEQLVLDARTNAVKSQQEVERLRSEGSKAKDSGPSLEQLQNLERELEQYRQLRVNPKDLAMFRKNKGAIKEYLKLVPTLVEQNHKMRARLSSLGFAMALEPIPNLKKLDIHMIDDESNSPNHRTPASATTSRRTTINNDDTEMTHMSGALNPPEDPVSTRPAKRQRVASLEEMQEKSSTDRELMPPPRQTLSRKLSVRKIIPTLRRKFNVRTPRLSTDRSHEGEMYSDNREPITPHDSDSVVEHRRVIGASDDASFPIASQNTPLQAFQDPKSSRVTNVTNSNFTFRSPSANAIQSDYRSQARLPQERSYLRLMDGLSYNDGIELGLQDPRQNMTYDVQPSNGHIPSLISPELLQYDQPVREQSMWRSGFPHFRRKPIETSVPPHETFQRGAYVNTGHNSSQELEAGGTIMPVTPMRQGSLDRNPPMDSVVSSCAKHIYQMPSGYENHGVAEVRGSSTRSGGYQLHDPQTSNSRPRWEAPRGLNGLSFIDTPLDSQNRPIRYQDGFVTSSSPHYTPTSKTFDGHIVRREQHESPYFSRSTYQPSTHLSINDRQSHRHQLAAPTKSYSSFKSPALSRLSALPQASPLTLKARSQPQWHRLQRAGVRSSRQGFQTQISNSHGIVQARQHPSTGLRGARR